MPLERRELGALLMTDRKKHGTTGELVLRAMRWKPAYSTSIIVVGVFLLSWMVDSRSVGVIALRSMLPAAGVLAIAGVGETLVVQQRGVDLSVPGVIALAAYLVSDLPIRYGMSPAFAIVLTLAISVVVGVVSGLIITKVGITAIIVTLGMNSLLIGVVVWYSGTEPVASWAGLEAFSSARWLGVASLAWLGVGIVFAAALLESFTSWGRQFSAVGASPGAARIAGLRVDRYVISAYAIAAGCYSLAGILLVGFVGASSTSLGDQYLLSVFVVVIIGGTQLRGGKATMIGTGLAALTLAQIDQAVLTLGATAAVQDIVEAAVLAVAAFVAVVNVPRLVAKIRILVHGSHSEAQVEGGNMRV